MNTFSLVIATIKRRKELEELLESITKINSKSLLEVIIIDQNENGFLLDIIKKYKQKLPIKYTNVNFKGSSKARNYGARIAKGSIIGFPDDDCEILQNTLNKVNEIFENNKDVIAVFGRVQDKKGNKDIINYLKRSTKINYFNLYKAAIECSFFIKREEFIEIGGFDENLGPGNYYAFDEGADIFFRLLYKKQVMKYIKDTFFYHPSKKDELNLNNLYNQGLGQAGLAKKHLKKYKRFIPYFLFMLKNLKAFILFFKGKLTNDKVLEHRNRIILVGRRDGLRSKIEI